MTQLVWAQSARRDLLGIANFYGKADPALPYELLMRIEQAPMVLLDFPYLGSPTARRDIRKWPVRNTPFILLYAHVASRIEIRRVVHVSSDWQAPD